MVAPAIECTSYQVYQEKKPEKKEAGKSIIIHELGSLNH